MDGYFIRRGDKTSCGGEVTGSDSLITIMGIEHAREGDSVTCGVTGLTYRIQGGVSYITSSDLRVAGTPWHTSAALMQRWFDSPGWEMPEEWKSDRDQPAPADLPRTKCDEDLVKMSWAMGFERCQIAVRKAELSLTTPNAIIRLKSLLENVGWKKTGIVSLGSPALSAREIDAASQINYVKLGTPHDTLDDMYGALGIATLKVGVAGKTFSKINSETQRLRNYFQVEHIGFYIRDHYDFNGVQFLGIWTEDRVLTKQEMARAALPSGQSIYNWSTGEFALVRNNDFRKYREKTSMGGDYVVYSDVLWRRANTVIDLGDAP